MNKARKNNSLALQELLDEATPMEMERIKVKMQLAGRIEDLVRARGWNNSQFAEKVDKNVSEITKWFSGTHNFTTDILTEIAFALRIEISALFGKQNLQVIYRNEIIVKTIASKPTVVLSTPMGQGNEVCGNYRFNGAKKGIYPMSQNLQA